MALVFQCSQCKASLRVGDEHAGNKVRCGSCQGVNTAPAAEPPPEDDVPVAKLHRHAPDRAALTADPVPVARSKARREDEGGGPRKSRERRPQPRKESSSVLPLVLGLAGAGLAMLLLVGGVAAWVLTRKPPAVAMKQDKFVRADNIPEDERRGPPRDDKMRELEQERERERELERVREQERQKEQPFVPAPPVEAKLEDGKFSARVAFDGIQGEPNDKRFVRQYRFTATAGKVYWVSLGEEGERFGRNCTLQVEGPDGPVAAPKDRQWDAKPEQAFEATRAGVYTASVMSFQREAACQLTVREVRAGEQLPAHLRIAPPDSALPTVAELQKLNVYDKKFTSAAFSPDGKFFYIAHADGTFAYYTDPKDTPKGTYKSDTVFGLCVDAKGRVYGQAGGARKGGRREQRPAADISLWDDLKPNGSAGALPAPSKTIPLRGVVTKTALSPDAKYVYFLDTHNRKLGRIDTQKQAIDKVIDTISGNTKSFCVTPDGKRIYACSTANQLYVIDAAKFEIEKTITLDKGNPSDVAATDKGLVFLVLPGANHKGGAMVDLTAGALPEKANVVELPIHHVSEVVRMMPDQKSVLFSADRHLQFCSVPARPGVDQITIKDAYNWGYFLPGQTVISPDGRTLLLELGVIFSVSR